MVTTHKVKAPKITAPVELARQDGAAGARSAPQPVRHEDGLAGMAKLASGSVALVLTDPPYFIDGMDDGWDRDKLNKRCKKGVVGGLPAGMKFDAQQGRNLERFLRPAADEWLRVLRPGGFVLCFAQPRLMHRAACAIEDAGFEIRDVLAWRYEGQAKAFSQEHFVRRRNLPKSDEAEMIAQLDGRKTPQLKPQMELIVLAQAPRQGTFVDNWLNYKAGLVDVTNPLIEPNKFPGTVIPVPKPRERYGHMTAKPVSLLRHLIRIFCAEGSENVVLDPFAGSGSTGVAAYAEGREFVGFEIDAAMSETANRRIADERRLAEGRLTPL